MSEDYIKDENDDEELEQKNILIGTQEILAQTELELKILQSLRQNQKDDISAGLQQKLQTLLDRIKGEDEQGVVTIRMHELAMTKVLYIGRQILVATHKKSQFRLVIAHRHMGAAYLDYKCYEQAIDHLTLALKKNSKLNQVQHTKLYHSYLLTTLSRCYIQIASCEDALEVLSRAEDIQEAIWGEQPQSRQIARLKAQCYAKLKNWAKASQFIKVALEFNKQKYGQKSIAVGKLKLQQAAHLFEQKKNQQAANTLTQGIHIFVEQRANRPYLAFLYGRLAQYCSGDKQIEALKQKQEMLVEEKERLKVSRAIVMALIKQGRKPQAMSRLQQILEGEEKTYGSGSLHVGKTLKMLGVLFDEEKGYEAQAEDCFKRAQKILQDQGSYKLVKQIKNKLASIKIAKDIVS